MITILELRWNYSHNYGADHMEQYGHIDGIDGEDFSNLLILRL